MSLSFPEIKIEALGDGDEGIFRTAEYIVGLIRQESDKFFIRQCAQSVIQDIPERDKVGEVEACFNFTKNNIRYTDDMIGSEMIQATTYILNTLLQGQIVMGDCDDSTVLVLSLLRSLGFMVRVKITAYDSSQEFTHVYGQVLLNNEWTAVDTIVKSFQVGDEAPNISRFKIYEV